MALLRTGTSWRNSWSRSYSNISELSQKTTTFSWYDCVDFTSLHEHMGCFALLKWIRSLLRWTQESTYIIKVPNCNIHCLHDERLLCFVLSVQHCFISQTDVSTTSALYVCCFIYLLHKPDLALQKNTFHLSEWSFVCAVLLLYIVSTDRTSSQHPREQRILSWDHVWNF